MRFSRRALLGSASLLAAGSVAGSVSGCAGAAENGSVPSFAYGSQPSQFAELSVPSGPGGGAGVPVVVVVHGGYWRTAYGVELGRPLAADLVTRGWAALNVEYRRVGSDATAGGGGWPNTCLDVAAAVDTLATQGQQLAGGRLDLSRVVGLGHSAGGHLVGWLAGRPGFAAGAPGAKPAVRLSGMVAQAGLLDLVGASQQQLGGGAVDGLMGGRPETIPQAYAQASPLAFVPTGIPSVCIHGEADYTVPVSQSETYVAAARQVGDTSELQRFDGDHFDLIDTSTPAWQLCVQALQRLL